MKLGRLLWKQIEESQGYAYISDSIETEEDDDLVLIVAKTHLEWAREVVRILERFIAKYSE